MVFKRFQKHKGYFFDYFVKMETVVILFKVHILKIKLGPKYATKFKLVYVTTDSIQYLQSTKPPILVPIKNIYQVTPPIKLLECMSRAVSGYISPRTRGPKTLNYLIATWLRKLPFDKTSVDFGRDRSCYWFHLLFYFMFCSYFVL